MHLFDRQGKIARFFFGIFGARPKNSEALPENLLRGVTNTTDVDEVGRPLAHLFTFSAEKCTNPERTDNFWEESINWHDHEDAIKQLFDQKKEENGKIQFKGGVAVIPFQKVRDLRRGDKTFSYERKEIPNNKFHGNLLLAKFNTKGRRAMICNVLAFSVERVIPNPNVAREE